MAYIKGEARSQHASTVTLKLYTLSHTVADEWLVGKVIHPTGDHSVKVLHGLLTYDEQAILKAMESKPNMWTNINSPLAFVVFGETGSVH